jgi:hypothetical protein
LQAFYGGVAGPVHGAAGGFMVTQHTISLAANERVIKVTINWGTFVCGVSMQTTVMTYSYNVLTCISVNFPSYTMSQLLYFTGSMSPNMYSLGLGYFA